MRASTPRRTGRRRVARFAATRITPDHRKVSVRCRHLRSPGHANSDAGGSHGIVQCGPVTPAGAELSGAALGLAGAAATRLHLVGRCPRVDITGAGNEVTIDLAGTISVTGTRDKVTWHDGLDGRQPSVTTTGLLSTVNHG